MIFATFFRKSSASWDQVSAWFALSLPRTNDGEKPYSVTDCVESDTSLERIRPPLKALSAWSENTTSTIYYLLKRNCWGTLTLMIYGRTWHPLTVVLAFLAFLSGPGTGKGFEDRSSCQTIAPYALWKSKQLIGGNNCTTLLRYYTSWSGRLETDVVLLGQCQWELYIKYKRDRVPFSSKDW